MANNHERLTSGVKFAYGLGELGPAMAGSTLIFFLLIFLTDVAGLSPALAGSVLLVGKIWDAVNDPLVGWFTDKTRSPWGRRLPWIVYGAGPLALLFFLQWIVPFGGAGGQLALFWYYVTISLAMNTVYTAVTLPYSALTPELTHDYDERTRLVGFRQAFSLGGSVGGLVVGMAVFQVFHASKQAQYALFAGLIALIILISLGICAAGIWKIAVQREGERLQRMTASGIGETKIPLPQQFSIIFANKPYLIVCAIYLFSWIAVQFTATILPFYVQSCLGLQQSDFYTVALVVQVTALLLLPGWGWLATHLGKKPVYFFGMSFWILAQGGLLFLEGGNLGKTLFLAVMAGAGVSVAYLIPFAMLPDVIELDELETGCRREGIFYGFVVFLQKSGLAVAQFIVGMALEFAGYISSGPGESIPKQPESALAAIRFSIGPLPALSLIIGLICVALFPITKARHEEICRKLQEKRGLNLKKD